MSAYRCTIALVSKTNPEERPETLPEFLIDADGAPCAAALVDALISAGDQTYTPKGVIVNVDDGTDFLLLNQNAED